MFPHSMCVDPGSRFEASRRRHVKIQCWGDPAALEVSPQRIGVALRSAICANAANCANMERRCFLQGFVVRFRVRSLGSGFGLGATGFACESVKM